MTTVQYILIIIAVVIMVVGLYLIVRGIMSRKNEGTTQAVIHDKNGIPIIPRHERHLVEETVEESNTDDAIIDDAATAESQDAFQQQLTSENTESPEFTHNDETPATEDTIAQEAQWQQPVMTEAKESNVYADSQFALGSDSDGEEDIFSSLASATESLMPAIEPAHEPDFSENSPMLDRHLLAEADQDQNSPLNHAQENINITLVPKNQTEIINGTKVLSLVSQYGLKYGAMNMFHRYESKDGTGILWFSMMGINEEGITPFDLNLLPTSRFNGLVLFLSLPHPKATQGFDSMMSVVNLISNDLDTLVLDENNEVLTRERRQQLRAQVQEYQEASLAR